MNTLLIVIGFSLIILLLALKLFPGFFGWCWRIALSFLLTLGFFSVTGYVTKPIYFWLIVAGVLVVLYLQQIKAEIETEDREKAAAAEKAKTSS